MPATRDRVATATRTTKDEDGDNNNNSGRWTQQGGRPKGKSNGKSNGKKRRSDGATRLPFAVSACTRAGVQHRQPAGSV